MKAVRLQRNVSCSPILATIPHGSSRLTEEVKYNIRADIALTNNDWFLNDLFRFLGGLGITTISANYSRYVIDVNRSIHQKSNNGEYTESFIYTKNTFGKDLYDRPLPNEIIRQRIEKLYLPFHCSLLEAIQAAQKKFPQVTLFDLHSFYAQSDADVVLGTRDGQTCSEKTVCTVYEALREQGFEVMVNEQGLRGGYIVSHYSAMENVEAVQVEIRYTSYIENRYFGEEEVTEKNAILFLQTRQRLFRAFQKIKDRITESGS